MQIRKIDTERRQDVEQFIRFPFELYKACPQWVPPLLSGERRVLDRRRHPFYAHSTADFFVAEQAGQTLGRVAVMHNRNHNRHRQQDAAILGYFDVVEDRDAARALLERVFPWAQERHLREIIGPKGLLGMDAGGVLVEGFEHRAAIGIPYNYAYYDDFLQEAGFKKRFDYLSGHLQYGHKLSERFYRIAERIKKRRGFRVKSFRTKAEMRQWAPRIFELYRQAFVTVPGYYPPTDAELAMAAERILSIAPPGLIKLVLKDDIIIGFLFSYHDISTGLQKARGRL
jgi:hypothetical protein